MPEPLKISSFRLPDGQTVDIAIVRLSDGRIVPRHPSDLITVPTRPAPSDQVGKP